MTMPAAARRRLITLLAFATIYLVWGSSYLAIRVGVQELPPALFAGSRFILAGVLLGAYARYAGQAFPASRREWQTIIVVGILLMLGGNGLVVWGEQWVPSSLAALIVSSVALWIAYFGTLGPQGEALAPRSVIGMIVGFAGVAVLVAPQGAAFSWTLFRGEVAVAAGALLWAAGTIYGRRRKPSTPALMSAAMQMLSGGVLLCGLGWGLGESARWVWTTNGMLSLAYLTLFASCLAYSAYVWLMHAVSPSQLGTYAYINPVIAVLMGSWLLAETLSAREGIGMLIILSGVILVSTAHRQGKPALNPEIPD
jgi:drug/metabolite transporter (DMT)-like permease